MLHQAQEVGRGNRQPGAAIAAMSVSRLDYEIDAIADRLGRLRHSKIALFSACVSERFSDFYPAFTSKETCGNPELARKAIDSAWGYLGGAVGPRDLRMMLRSIEEGMPNPAEFSSLEAVLAQNLCIAIDSTLRWCLRDPEAQPIAGAFGIEILRAAISQRETGFIDVGSGAEAMEFESRLANDSVVVLEFKMERNDLDALEIQAAGNLAISEFRSSSIQNRIDVRKFIGKINSC